MTSGPTVPGGDPSVPYWGNVLTALLTVPFFRPAGEPRRTPRAESRDPGSGPHRPPALVKPARRTGGVKSPPWPPGTRRAEAFASKHGIPRVVDSYAALVEDPDIDAVYNPLPNGLHGYWTIEA